MVSSKEEEEMGLFLLKYIYKTNKKWLQHKVEVITNHVIVFLISVFMLDLHLGNSKKCHFIETDIIT